MGLRNFPLAMAVELKPSWLQIIRLIFIIPGDWIYPRRPDQLLQPKARLTCYLAFSEASDLQCYCRRQCSQ